MCLDGKADKEADHGINVYDTPIRAVAGRWGDRTLFNWSARRLPLNIAWSLL